MTFEWEILLSQSNRQWEHVGVDIITHLAFFLPRSVNCGLRDKIVRNVPLPWYKIMSKCFLNQRDSHQKHCNSTNSARLYITHNIHLVLTDFINMKMACTLMKNKISLGQSIPISPQIKLLMTFFGLADLSLGLNIEVLMGMIEMYF